MTTAGALDYQVRGPTPALFQPLALGSILSGSSSTTVTLPFDFDFYGQPVREVALSRYGYLVIGGAGPETPFNQPIPHSSTFAPVRFIAPWWDAFASTTTPTPFSWRVTGVAPSRQVTFEWREVSLPSFNARVSMQVTLFESTGVIRFSYGTVIPGTVSGTIGVQRAPGDGLAVFPCSSTGTCLTANWPGGQMVELVPRFQTNATCGSTTASCTRCSASQWCRAGQCEQLPCNFLTCSGCCFNDICYPRSSAQNTAVCGVNGAICDACPAGATCTQGVCRGGTFCDERTCADGCCSNATTCVRHTGQAAQTCGTGGSVCRACTAGFTCQGGQCVPPSPCLVVSEEAIDFGNVAPGCRSLTRTIRLTNTCFNNQTVSGITLTPSPEFQLGALPTFPLTVGLGLSASFTVSYRPVNLGPDSATLSISSNGTQTIALNGVGGSGVNVAGFTAPSKTDVLLVLDNSCSMTDKQQAIASNPGALFGFAFDAGVDFHFGIATTDESDLGALQVDSSTNASFVTQRTVPFRTTFANLIGVVGINGGPIEAGLVSASLALRPPQVAQTPNTGFLRHDAALAVWFVSDAPDQSSLPATHYLDLLRRVKADPNRFSAHGVLATLPVEPVGCGYDGASDTTRYATVITPGNGVLDEICTTQWTSTLEHVAPPLFGRRETWFLQTAVDPLVPVSVTVDGAMIPQGAQTWSFDTVQNAVRFTPARAPRPRQQLVITSSAACLP